LALFSLNIILIFTFAYKINNKTNMKKILALLALVCFVALTSNAQTAQSADTKKETTVAKSDSPAMPACCAKANKACCKNNTAGKACTGEQKAECAKAGAEKPAGCHHAEADAKEPAKAAPAK
jgi:hypothetical protein